LLRRAIENAYKLSLRTGIPTKDTIKLILKKAINEAALLAQNLPEDIRPVKFEVQPQETPKQEETTEEDKPREEESKEDQAIEGLGALFGF
jgi:large subunit ribosomal protein L10